MISKNWRTVKKYIDKDFVKIIKEKAKIRKYRLGNRNIFEILNNLLWEKI